VIICPCDKWLSQQKRQQNLQEEVGVALRKTQEEIKQQMDRRRREVEK